MKVPHAPFAWKTVQFVILVVILDLVGGCILSHLYFSQKSGNYALVNEGIYRTQADFLVFGSSNAIHHFDPQVIKEMTGMDTFHLGRDGFEIIYHNAVFHCVLRRRVPKIVVLSLTPIELSNIDTYDRLAALLPYAQQFPHVRKVIDLRGKFEFLKLRSRLYTFNSMLISLLNGLKPPRPSGTAVQPGSGYKPLYGRINLNRELLMIKNERALDKNRVAALEAFMAKADALGIRMVVVFPPWYYHFGKDTLTKQKVRALAGKYGVTVLDYLTSKLFVGRGDLFWDEGHLNQAGAEKLTRAVVGHIGQGK